MIVSQSAIATQNMDAHPQRTRTVRLFPHRISLCTAREFHFLSARTILR